MGRLEPVFAPRLLPSPDAAHYLGISETKLRGLAIPRRILDGKRLYDRHALDEYASGLPLEGETKVNTCDDIFGD